LDVEFGQDGQLYLTDRYGNNIRRYDGTTGLPIDVFASGGNLDTPFGLCFGPDRNLYVSDVGNGSIKRYNGLTGEFIDEFVSSGSGGLLQPNYLVFTPEPATLLLLGLGAAIIRKFRN